MKDSFSSSSRRLILLGLSIALLLFSPLQSSAQVPEDAETILDKEVNAASEDSSALERSWNRLSAWEKLEWYLEHDRSEDKASARRSILKLLTNLAVEGSAAERKDFLVKEVHKGFVQKLAINDDSIKRKLAELYAATAVDALQQKQTKRARRLLKSSVTIEPDLPIQKLIQEKLPKKVAPKPEQGMQVGGILWFIIVLLAGGAVITVVSRLGGAARIAELISSFKESRVNSTLSASPRDNSTKTSLEDSETALSGGKEASGDSSASIDEIFQDPESFADETIEFDFGADEDRD